MEPGAGRGDGILRALWRPRFALLNFTLLWFLFFLSFFVGLGLGVNSSSAAN